MSVIGFVRSAGARLFGLGKSEPEALKEQVEAMGMDNKNLDISFDDGKVSVNGSVADQAEKERLLLVLGNVEGVESVDDRISVRSNAEPASAFHTVVRGDTLGAIAQKHYGKANLYPKIYEANRPMLENPDKIYPGQVLRIPPN